MTIIKSVLALAARTKKLEMVMIPYKENNKVLYKLHISQKSRDHPGFECM